MNKTWNQLSGNSHLIIRNDLGTVQFSRSVVSAYLWPHELQHTRPPWEKAMATHSSTLAWKIPWMEEPGRLQSMGSLRVGMTEQLHFHFSFSCIGEGNGNPLQCSCLENPRDGVAWWAAVYGVAQSQTRLKWLSSSSSRPPCPSPTPGVYSESCPLNPWCHSTISSSVVPFSFHLQFFPGSGSFQMSQFFTWPKYWSFSFSISPSNEYLGLISLRTDCFDCLAVHGTLKSLLQYYSSKTSIRWC